MAFREGVKAEFHGGRRRIDEVWGICTTDAHCALRDPICANRLAVARQEPMTFALLD
jgi:hypothetical protein